MLASQWEDPARGSRPRRGRWSDAESGRLSDWYGLREIEDIAAALGRSVESVQRKADSMFPIGVRSGPWSAAEVEKLKLYLGRNPHGVIAQRLGRTESEVRRRIALLGRRLVDGAWTRKDLARLKKIYGSRTDENLAKIFGRPIHAVRAAAEGLRLAKDKAFLKKLEGTGSTKMPRWTSADTRILESLYSTHSNLEIAERLGRSVKSVVSKAHNIGLRKSSERLREMGRENVRRRYDDDEASSLTPKKATSRGGAGSRKKRSGGKGSRAPATRGQGKQRSRGAAARKKVGTAAETGPWKSRERRENWILDGVRVEPDRQSDSA